MAFLPIEKISEHSTDWTLHCCFCGKKVGTLDHSEILPFLAYLTATNDVVMCFDCEKTFEARRWSYIVFQQHTRRQSACLVKHNSANDAAKQ